MTAVFLYGTLQPGERAWRMVEPYAVGEPRRATVAGRLFDTGCFPALLLDDSARAPGTVVDVRDEDALMDLLDRYEREGSMYKRLPMIASDGTTCWTYVWIGDMRCLLAELPDGWPAAVSAAA